MTPVTNPAPAYFDGSRPEVANLVPESCRSILDVGCGFGGLGRRLRSRGFNELYGIEINPDATSKLEGLYAQHWIGDVEKLALPLPDESLDCIIFADVLEHLVDPWGALRRYLRLLRSGGTAIVSVPNVRNISLLYRLFVKGRWDYEDSGLLDRTHLRFFTRYSAGVLIDGAGLQIDSWHANRDQYTGGRKLLSRALKIFVDDIDICQYIVVARKP
jgi:SAM-dependent methyltransferase